MQELFEKNPKFLLRTGISRKTQKAAEAASCAKERKRKEKKRK